MVLVGIVFGGVEVAVAASFGADAAGPLLGLWGIGSLLGGLAAARFGGGARNAAGLALILVALGVLHALLALAGSPLALGAIILLAGSTIAPTYATAYAMVDAVAPAGTATEAFSWLATAIAIGTAAGSAGAGALIDFAGPQAAFAAAGLSALFAATIALSRTRTLPGAAPVPALNGGIAQ
jgi:predicted MFS family arabinose efflux permease